MYERQVLLAEIAAEEARLASLGERQAEVRARLDTLRAQLASAESAMAGSLLPRPGPDVRVPETATDKVTLFRSLFRGRTDLFSRRWQNTRTGKSGYAPACANEWVRGICEKPRVRCGDCPHQAFLPVSDSEIIGHLQGRHVLGLYPLLTNERCWLLAADFDDASWQEDVGAFAEACRSFRLPVAVERSRSGSGGHAWLFFEAPVAATLARRMGCALLTEPFGELPHTRALVACGEMTSAEESSSSSSRPSSPVTRIPTR